MPSAELTRCGTALKEWATVLEAIGRGEQLVLIRKGGLIEPSATFELAAPSFVFYPTFEHQAVQYLREPYGRYVEEAWRRRAPDGQVRLDLVGQAVRGVTCADPAIVQRLAPFHIYNDAFLTQRLTWQPDQPLVIVIVRAFRLAEPCTVPVQPQYAGCKSWVQLDAPVPLAGAVPIMDETAFNRRLRELTPLLG